MKKEIIFQEDKKQRLDKFLTEELRDFSRSQIQKLIKEGRVLVNDKEALVHHFLKFDDKIIISVEKSQEKKKDFKFKPKIIFENNDYLVLNKPSGIAVEGSQDEYCLLDWLREKVAPAGDPEFDNRHGLIHRLDKDVSGVILIAKNPEFFYYLKSQFKKRSVKKIYLALVCGQIEKDEGRLDYTMARGKEGKMVARPVNQEGKLAISEFQVLKRFRNYTYLKIKILTGRTHQIRVHFFAFNHSVVGDKLYNQKKIKAPKGLERLFLHSHLLGFYDLNNEWQEYKSDLPKELNDVLLEL